MSKANDKKAKVSKIKSKATGSAYKRPKAKPPRFRSLNGLVPNKPIKSEFVVVLPNTFQAQG